MVRLIPNRLKSHNGKNGVELASPTRSRGSSPLRGGVDGKHLVLKTTVLKARNLAAKDKNGTSDPYLVVTLGDAKESTPAISKTINPEWNVSFDLPISGIQALLLEAVCWDRDRFGKDYMGDFDIALEDIFTDGKTIQEPKWYALKSERRGTKKKKDTVVSGEVQMQFSIVDPSNPSATSQDILQRFMSLANSGPAEDADEDDELARLESLDTREDEDDDEKEDETSDETDDPNKPEVAAKRRRKLRLKRLRRKTKARAYEFTGGTDVVGIAFLEIGKITDLPPERNMTRTSFDMDPFVVVSLGRKTYRTRVIRHNLNPVYDEKMVFQVMRHEQQYSLSFSVVDRDKLSGNDFVGTVTIPLSSITSIAPEADPETGLYHLPEPPEPTAVAPHKPRFRLPISRSSSSSSLNKLSRPPFDQKPSQASITGTTHLDLPSPPISVPSDRQSLGPVPSLARQDSGEESAQQNCHHPYDPDLKPFILPLVLKNKDRWEAKHTPQLFIKAKYLPYPALRQQFWRAMLKQYDADDSARVSKVELTTMLDTLGSTLKESTIDSFFTRFSEENGSQDTGTMDLTFDQAVICLENQLQQGSSKKSWSDTMKGYMSNAHFSMVSNGEKPSNDGEVPAMEGYSELPLNNNGDRSAVPSISQEYIGAQGEAGDMLDRDDLTDERGEEHVIEIAECPLCRQPRLNKRSDADIITHIATCASQDWRQINNIVMAGFVTPSQAQRKWYSKVITKISYGGYKLGANSANILVQDRITGQINEERMSVYVRLGIRLMYKGLKSREMEKKRIKKLLRSLSIKQGRKYDDPASAREIPSFINFHKLDMSEVLRPLQEFKNFNEFFYRQLKPDARPCSAPDNPKIIVSPADCRSVVFNQIDEATKIWVKGRGFSVERLLGKAYPEDAKRYANGAMGIFRLAPQDYHRFHVPVDGIMDKPRLIEGEYYTVNPMAIRSALDVYGENVRVVVPIDSVAHGRVMVICVGAMMVGSTVITRKAGERVARAEELGYFKFGGSTLLVLFEPGKMKFDDDIVDNASQAVETLLRVGMSIGHHPQQSQHTPDMRKKDENVTQEERQDAKRRIEGSLAPEMLPDPANIKSDPGTRQHIDRPGNSSKASMTTYATRSPLQLLTNTHAMVEPRRTSRRTSARLADKDDLSVTNGVVHTAEKGKSGQGNGTSGKHGKVNANSAAIGGAGGRGKRKHDYEEEVDGLLFTRTRSKRTKATPAVYQSEPVREEPQEELPKAAPAKSKRKKSFGTPSVPAPAPGEKDAKGVKRRRSARNSQDGTIGDPPVLDVKKRRGKPQAHVDEKARKDLDTSKAAPIEAEGEESIQVVGGTSQLQPVEIPRDATKIALPFADTPIIRRNKEMRKGADTGHRRSSMSNRGRRASSLIDTGKSNGESKRVLEHNDIYTDGPEALPHDEVDSAEFYKHIESDGLPEPRRMRQLLTWCGTRALGEKPSFSSEDSHAKLAAREIQQQLLKDFSSRSEMSDWFSREDSVPNPQPPKPNPKNISNQAKIQDLEQQLARLHTERQTWESLLHPPSPSLNALAPLSTTTLPTPSTIDPGLLPPSQLRLLQSLQSLPALSASIPTRLQTLSRNLEFSVDAFADGVHHLSNWVHGAERVADRVLAVSARVLAEREREGVRRAGGDDDGKVEGGQGGGEVGSRVVLRGLSRVVDR